MEFHVSRKARKQYGFEAGVFSGRGTVCFETVEAARALARKINAARDLSRHPRGAVTAGQLHAMGLIEEILRHVVELYRESKNPRASSRAIEWLHGRVGEARVEAAERRFVEEFPPPAVDPGGVPAAEYLAGGPGTAARADRGAGGAPRLAGPTGTGARVEAGSGAMPNRETALVEMLMLHLANTNPAYAPFLDLFGGAELARETALGEIVEGAEAFFGTQPTFGPDDQNLVEMLRSPQVASPHSLFEQLEYIWRKWGYLLGGRYPYLFRLLRGLDVLREEGGPRPLGPGLAHVYEFTGLASEAERFTPDRDWMPRCVLLAKNIYVWLDQLSKKYRRPITKLDQVPDEEFDLLGRWGFTALWLIGLWERSRASQRIKQMRGNPDAVASAYSLFDYTIAEDLGGEPAYRTLQERAWKRGIRLASDMVPNHMGIDSRWVIEHPDWFLSLDHSPYPAYGFTGPDLSGDGRVGIHLEDHYFDATDAAVVFKRVDRWTGAERYVYHGNDGTSMPWNDTAQLDYLNPEVREAVIGTIVHVARLFPVIRFDAAMTLTKRHYQRLWFPAPGSGGAIPSRAERGMTKEEFDARMPEEFWREVVDRIAREAPDTLLLAEAFWLMEGYFVRSLGMHRVYNSAFMVMLRDEDNASYRQVIKNTLEFDPEILKRYVNFMNNPDERTAVDQFGAGDKYLGVCTLMATLPGLPMFGHGQIEGFAEKYGMEFRRPLLEEIPDQGLVERHEREIFPLLHCRRLFAEVENFLLYDFFSEDGGVNEDVFAYSNRRGDERGLVVYQNRFAPARGWIRTSAAYGVKTGGAGGRTLVQRSLGEGLGLRAESDFFTIFRDQPAGLEYLRKSLDIHANGLYLELDAYGRHVFLDFREVRDDEDRRYARLEAHLGGRGVASLEQAWKELFLAPVHKALLDLVNADMLRRLMDARLGEPRLEKDDRQGAPAHEGESSGTIDAPTTGIGASGVRPSDGESLSRAAHHGAQAGAGSDPPAERRKQPGGAGSFGRSIDRELLREIEARLVRLLLEIKNYSGGTGDEVAIARSIRRRLAAALELRALEARAPSHRSTRYREAAASLVVSLGEDRAAWGTLFGWIFVHALGRITGRGEPERQSRSWIDELLLDRVLDEAFRAFGLDEPSAERAISTIRVFTKHQAWFERADSTHARGSTFGGEMLRSLLLDEEVRNYLRVNLYDGTLWFNQEAFEEVLRWMRIVSAIDACAAPAPSGAADARARNSKSERPALPTRPSGARSEMPRTLVAWDEVVRRLADAGRRSGYKLEGLIGLVGAKPRQRAARHPASRAERAGRK